MTVASEKREGVGGISTHILYDVYAVKTGSSTAWSPFLVTSKGFEYELKEVLSKTKKRFRRFV